MNGQRSWKVYGPDLNGVYGGLQGIGGLEAVVRESDGATTGIINDYFGNCVASVNGGTVTWNETKVGGYGPLPNNTAKLLSATNTVADVTVWRGKRIDPTGYYYLGARYYDPQGGRFISPDPMGHGASMSLYDYANGDPINGCDPDGREIKELMDVYTFSGMNPDERKSFINRVLPPDVRGIIEKTAYAHDMSPNLLGTVILNELIDIDKRDFYQQTVPIPFGSYGIAQIQVSTAIQNRLTDIEPTSYINPLQRQYDIKNLLMNNDAASVEAAARRLDQLIDGAVLNKNSSWQQQFGSPSSAQLRDVNITGDRIQMLTAAYNSPDIQIAKNPGNRDTSDEDYTFYPNGRIHGSNCADLFNNVVSGTDLFIKPDQSSSSFWSSNYSGSNPRPASGVLGKK